MTKILFLLVLIIYSCGSRHKAPEINEDSLKHIKNAQPKATLTTKIGDSNFLPFWKKFVNILKSKNQTALIDVSFDSLNCEHKIIPANEFIKSCFSTVFNDSLTSKLSDESKLDFIDEEIDGSYLPQFVTRQLKTGKVITKKVNVQKVDKYPPIIIVLEFFETKSGFRFYGYDKFG